MACAAGDGGTKLLPPAHVMALLSHARRHNLEARVLRCLAARDDLHATIVDLVARRQRERLVQHLRMLSDLRRVARLLQEAEISWVVIKGPALGEMAYRDLLVRDAKDLDILVAPAAFRKAVEVLEADGNALHDRNWDLVVGQARGQLHLDLPAGTALDLHWHVINRDRDIDTLGTGELLSRRRSVKIAGLDAFVLESTDALLHLVVHAQRSGGRRLSWLLDADQAIRHDPPDWDMLVQRAHRWGVSAAVAALLARSAYVLKTPLPRGILEQLQPRRVMRYTSHAVDVLLPTEHLRIQPPSFSGLSGVRGILAVGRRTMFRAAHLGSFGPDPRREKGGPAGRERFLQLVDAAAARDRRGMGGELS